MQNSRQEVPSAREELRPGSQRVLNLNYFYHIISQSESMQHLRKMDVGQNYLFLNPQKYKNIKNICHFFFIIF